MNIITTTLFIQPMVVLEVYYHDKYNIGNLTYLHYQSDSETLKAPL